MALPTGTVTFLFTDIEGSTQLSQVHRDQRETLRARHHAILHKAVQDHNGFVFQIIEDAFCIAFHTAVDACRVAADAQRILFTEAWDPAPIKVCMGIHSGTAHFNGTEGYTGYITLARTNRLMSAGHGGQVLVSLATEELIRDEQPEDIALLDLGSHRLKDLNRPEQIFQLILPGLPADFPPLKTLDIYRHNLPTQITSFIGRVKEMQEIKGAISTHRLVTLTGSGGSGKTRLALQVAADLLDLFPDGVWFVELAPLSDPDLIPQSILSACGIPEQQGRTSLDILRDYLRERRILLILDNCEHLIADCARLGNDLLSHAHNLNILATSRESLGVAGEFDWVVPSLSLPDAKHALLVEQLSQYESVQLFIERAHLVQPHFTVTNRNAPAVAQICSRLDGIPLALELAAARVRALTVEEISSRLDDRFRLLTGGARTSLPRQQTLRATLDWSYNLLTEEEKKLLRSLAVFSGGWTLDAAEKICCPEENGLDVLDLLSRLVDKSLVAMEESSGRSRYRLLETTRQYAREKSIEANEAENLQDKHLDFFLQMAEGLFTKTIHSDLQSLNALEVDNDNLRAALEHGIGRSPARAVRLGVALEPFWKKRGYPEEGYAWAKRILACTDQEGTTIWRGRALGLIALFTLNLGKSRLAKKYGEASLEIARTVDDKYQLAYMNYTLAYASMDMGDFDNAGLQNEECQSQFKELNIKWGVGYALYQKAGLATHMKDPKTAHASLVEASDIAAELNAKDLLARVLNAMGELARLNGDYTQAASYYQESLHLHQETGNKLYLSLLVSNLCQVAIHENDPDRARKLLSQALETARQFEHPRILLSCLEDFAGVATIEGRYELAALLFGSAQAAHEMMGMTHVPADEMEFNRCIEIARQHLDKKIFKRLWQEGMKMSMEAALALATETLKDV